MKEKSSYATSIIGGADGPTSVFLVGKPDGKKRFSLQKLKHRFRKWNYNRKQKMAMTNISANPHTLDEVITYMKKKYHAEELDPNSHSYQFRKGEMKAGLIQQYAPELLGEMPQLAPEDYQDEQKLKLFMEKINERQKMAASVSDEIFKVDYACYQIKSETSEITIEIEKSRGYVTASWSGKGKNHKASKVVQDIFLYYGTTKDDIENKTERYRRLISILCSE